uniref:N-acetyltransferase domain-containing protein n=1 Tax=Haptolina brevifila TaxID=156173 RepID=A0A7S2IGZ9_9EUKA|mmetsp:Transcript_65897/g.130670  ORF Transcript_65897/g.130670 Transcript_65897/m.130670 type:complete len:626 (+) Transcript_65897:285-2162(+)
MVTYIVEARKKLNHQTFAAISSTGEVIGTAACQLWSGPMPLVTTHKIGTCWGVFVQPAARRHGVATALMRAVMNHWREIGCVSGVLICASEDARRIYERLGFGAGKVLLLNDLPTRKVQFIAPSSITVAPAGEEADIITARHLRSKWLESGLAESNLESDLEQRTFTFIAHARRTLEYQAFVARDGSGRVVGSASCQVWEGPGSNNHSWQRLIKIGVVWGLYVEPQNRKQGEAQLLEAVVARWKAINCTKGFVFACSGDDAALFTNAGFAPHNAMVVELHRASTPDSVTAACANLANDANYEGRALSPADLAFVETLRATADADITRSMSTSDLASLRLALPQMLEAALPNTPAGCQLKVAALAAQAKSGTFIDPNDNWFTRNVKRFGGGFDMLALTSQPGLLASKFDKLSDKYDQWSVGNRCTYYGWLARMMRAAPPQLRGPGAMGVDVACGVGLPGHMLRLCGFKGSMIGTDISPGMLSQARERRVYQHLTVANANEGLGFVEDRSVDLLVCMGAMELLNHGIVLAEFARMLKPTGRIWVSFQWEGATDEAGSIIQNPTEHQNVKGITLPQLTQELEATGFDMSTAIIEKSQAAFFTPSPKMDGSLLPVPYLYVAAGLRPGAV